VNTKRLQLISRQTMSIVSRRLRIVRVAEWRAWVIQGGDEQTTRTDDDGRRSVSSGVLSTRA